MADEMVTLRIRVAGNPRDIDKFNKKIQKMAVDAKLATTNTNKLSGSFGQLNQRIKQWNKQHPLLSKGLSMLIGMFDKLGKLTVKLGTIGFAVILASLSALTGAFALGNLAVKAYRVSMAALAGVAAAATAAIAAFAAAQRELVAATNAYTNKSAPALGSAFNQSRAALRNLQTDAQLATAGMQALNATFAAVSKNASFDAKATKALRALDDFASAGGDRGKNLAAAGEFYGLLAKGIGEGKLGLTAEIEAAGKAISPAFEKGLKEFKKKSGKKDLKSLQQSILTGELAQLGGVAGQAQAVNDTLISILKGYFTRLQTLFADLGQPLLKPLKEAADKLFKILRDTFLRIAPDIEAFGKGTLLDGLVTAFEKLSNFVVLLFRKYLPQTKGMLQGIGMWWKKFVTGWNIVVEKLQGAVQAGREVNRIFGPVLLNVFKRLGDMFSNTQKLIGENEDRFQSLANALNNVLQLASNIYTWFTEALVQAAPAIEVITSATLRLVDAMGMLLEGVQAIARVLIPGGGGNALGGLAQIGLLLFGGGMLKQLSKGGFAGGIGNAARNTGIGKVATGVGTVVSGGAGVIGRGAGRIKTGLTGGGGTGTGGIGSTVSGAIGRGKGRVVTPFTTGYGRGRASGGGVLSSTGRGIKGSYKSATRGGISGKSLRGGKLGFGGGMATNIGSALAINALGNVMDPSAQPGMQLGATVAGFAGPLAGLGVGLGKAAWDSKTAGGGALLGAGSGAAIGAMVGGPVGAVIGAAIGGVAGAVKGMMNKISNEKKAARAAAGEVVTGYKNEVLAGMLEGTGGTALGRVSGKLGSEIKLLKQFKGMSDVQKKMKADQMLASGQITKSEYDNITRKQLDTYTGELEKQGKVLKDAARGPIKTYNNRMGELTKMTGKSQQELHDLSMTMGVNLYDDTLDLATAMEKLGLAVDLTVEGIIGASRDLSVKALGVFDEVINRAEATSIIDEAAETLRQLGGGAGQADFATFYRTLFEQLTILNPNASQFELIDMFKKQVGTGGTAYARGTGPLGGLGATAAATGSTQLADKFVRENLASQQGLLADQVVTALAGSNLSVNRADLITKFRGMSSEQLMTLQDRVASGDFAAFTDKSKNTAASQAERALGLGVDVVAMAKTLPEQLSLEAENLRQELVNGITEGFKNTPEWFKTPPEWFNKESFEALAGDTSSPRGGRIGDTSTSRTLGRTMSRHGYFNSMITGKRNVTSAYRTWGLGSSNSDHVTGRAYDLTGQNLGMYQSAVRASGGFAEFHGLNGDRHLHVVPGQTPVGDMATPRMSGSSVSMPSVASSSDNVTINVYGATGQDEGVIAQKVITLLEKRQRSVRERL